MDILNLKDLEVLKVEENEFDYLITAQAKDRPEFCIKCYHNNLIKHSTNERIISDVCIHSKRTKIQLIHRRYKCKDCGYTFYELLESIDTNSRLTKRLISTVSRESITKPFKTIEEQYAISNMTVRRIFDKRIDELENNRVLVAPRVLGIDEAHLNYKMRGVLTDTENNRLIEITPDNTKPSIKKAIQSMKGWENIEVVTMDMAKGYRYTVNEMLPNALVIVDKFHVVQYAQMALNRVRVDYKNKLDILLDMIYQSHKRKIISWRDIEDCQYGEHRLDHKTILKAFQREKMDFYKYVLSKGFVFKPNSWGMTEYSADGEKLKSIYEIDFSNYLNLLGFKYKNGYERDVMYKQFCNIDYDTKMNCDYVIHKDNEDYYIEIAGILYSEKDLDKVNKGKRKEIYRQKMNKKIDALSKSNVKSLILYSHDMKTGKYKEIVNNFLGIKEVKQCQSVVNE